MDIQNGYFTFQINGKPKPDSSHFDDYQEFDLSLRGCFKGLFADNDCIKSEHLRIFSPPNYMIIRQ
jgi:hypothetical protein